MHTRCLSRCFDSLRPDGPALEEGEFTCPVCRRISNLLLPVQIDRPTTTDAPEDDIRPSEPLPSPWLASTGGSGVSSWLRSNIWEACAASMLVDDDEADSAAVDELCGSLARVLRHESSKLHIPPPATAPLLSEGRVESVLLLVCSTNASAAVSAHGCSVSSLLSMVRTHTPQVESLRQLAAAAAAACCQPSCDGFRQEVLRILRASVVEGEFGEEPKEVGRGGGILPMEGEGLDEGQRMDPRGGRGGREEGLGGQPHDVPPVLSLDLSALLVSVTLLWPAMRWREGEWRRLLHICYAALAVQLVVCAGLMHIAMRREGGGLALHSPPAGTWMRGLFDQLVAEGELLKAVERAVPSPLQALLRGAIPHSPLSGESAQLEQPSLSGVVDHGLLLFLKHAYLFAHAADVERRGGPSDVGENEIGVLLAHLGLPPCAQLAAAIGSEFPSLIASWMGSLRHAVVPATSASPAALELQLEPSSQPQSEGSRGGPLVGLREGSAVKFGADSRGISTSAELDPSTLSLPNASAVFGALVNRCASLGPVPARSPFLALPTNFSELYNDCVRRKCMQCGTSPVQPAVCLLCGTLVCVGSDCCRDGGDEECCIHAQECHHGVGVFVVVRTTATLLVIGRRYCWWGSLYLDAHGEEDRGLMRGRPLLLAKNRLQELTALWQANSLREFLHNNPPPFPHLLLLRNRTA